ncbi:LysR family transcriptional regulator [Dyella humicola]|uniref:LysR family transcriptional regulator n=1 Tax=Dyella humicola TaxID=2992126 RepID=UPI00224D37F1|nr:LysR family transcriptional regulator [Dyella humicola]
MSRININDLVAFVAVGTERSFTRAAAKLGVTPSALSHLIRALEDRVGVQLLVRTTRSVAPTETGERFLRSLSPLLDELEGQLVALGELRNKPAGTVRITADEHAAESILWPALRKLLPAYPDIHVEIVVDYGLTDIVAERFDAGVRIGGAIAKDMVAIPIGPAMRLVTVGSPSYLARYPRPKSPQDLTTHRCINLRLPTYGGLLPWEYEKRGRSLRVRGEGQVTFNSSSRVLAAALDGFGLAYLPERMAAPHIARGKLEEVLGDWSQPFAGYHLYYPSRRQKSSAFKIIADALHYSPNK